MKGDDSNEQRVALYRPPGGACLHLHGAGLLTGHGTSHYAWTPRHFGPHLVLRGRGTFCWPGGRADVRAGTMFALLPGMEVDYHEAPDDPWQYLWLHIDGSEVAAFAEGCGFTATEPVRQIGDVESVRQAMQDLCDCLDDSAPAHPYAVQACLYRFALRTSLACGALPRREHEESLIDRARAAIDSQLHTGINVAELAALLNVSRTTLFYAFRRALGQSPVAYLRRQRVQRVRELLSQSPPPRLADVARACGFRDAKYMARTFKQFTGCLPSGFCGASSV